MLFGNISNKQKGAVSSGPYYNPCKRDKGTVRSTIANDSLLHSLFKYSRLVFRHFWQQPRRQQLIFGLEQQDQTGKVDFKLFFFEIKSHAKSPPPHFKI